MKILIFGGSGFVGRHLAACLRQRGHEVTIPSRRDVDWMRPDAAAAGLTLVSLARADSALLISGHIV